MKKLFTKTLALVAMLAMTISANAKQYCGEEMTLSGSAKIQLSCIKVSDGNYQIIIEGENLNGLGGSFYNPGAKELRTAITTNTSTKIVCDIAAESAPSLYTPLYVMCPTEQNVSWPNDIEWGVCGSGDAKTASELSINATEKTLDATNSETFQIVATTAQGYDGTVTYASSKDGIATVSASGLVTAAGRGTATITVTAPETENFAASTKKLTVTVTGPINWEGVDWLGGSDNKYKIVVDPAGPNIVNVQTRDEKKGIYIEFPSAVWGDCSLDAADYTTQGAGRWYFLSAFKKMETAFTQICQGVTYTFNVYYADGEPEDLTGFNIAKNKTVVAGHSSTPAANANDGKFDTRWGSEGAAHYATAGEAAEDWWYVDLGDFYDIDSIRIWFETACPTDYDLLISNNAAGWTVLGTYTEQPKTGYAADKANVYKFNNKTGRYLKIFARNGYNNLQYGISMWEFEAYGKHGTPSDTNRPTMVSATLSGEPEWNKVNIAVSATDDEDGVVTGFHVVDATNGINLNCEAEEGIIIVTGLSGETEYSFSVSAIDVAGNESENAIVVNATTPTDTSVPLVTAPIPSGINKEVRPIYSDAFDSILAHPFDKDGFAGVALLMEKEISGDHFLVYNVAGANEITWGMYDDGNNAIIAADGYHSENGKGVDASAMEYMHLDIWSLQSANNAINICINDAGLKTLRLSHGGEGWQSYNIDLTEFAEGEEGKKIDNVRWMKFSGIGFITGKVALDNLYFYKEKGSATALGNTAEAIKAVKVIENGQLIIIKNGIRYNVAGQIVK